MCAYAYIWVHRALWDTGVADHGQLFERILKEDKSYHAISSSTLIAGAAVMDLFQ